MAKAQQGKADDVTAGPEPTTIVYCDQDSAFLDQLEAALKPLVDDGVLRIDYRRKITGSPTKPFKGRRSAKADASTVLLVVLSPWMMASDYLYSPELLEAAGRNEGGECKVLPVLVQPTRWSGSSLAAMPVLPDAGDAVSRWEDPSAAWDEVIEGVSGAIRSLQRDRSKGKKRRRRFRTLVSSAPNPRYDDDDHRRLGERLEALYGLRELVPKDKAVAKAIQETSHELGGDGALRPGEILVDGRFRLVMPIRETSLVNVWLALERASDELVTVEALKAAHRKGKNADGYFAAMAQSLDHPRIPRTLVERAEHRGIPVAVTSFAGDRSLEDAIMEGLFDEETALQVLIDATRAVGALHGADRVHGSLSPASVLLADDGGAFLVDAGKPDLAAPGALGSLYAAPESLESSFEPDAAADVYSLGMTALFTLRGSALPASVLRNPESVIGVLECAEPLKEAIRGALEWEPGARPSAEDFAAAMLDDPAVVERLAISVRHSRPDAATFYYRRLLHHAPEESRWKLALAECEAAAGRTAEAQRVLADVLNDDDLDPTAAAEALRRLRHIAESTGEWNALIQTLRKRLASANDADPEQLAELARLHEEQSGDLSAARATWQLALAKHRNPDQARRALQALMRYAENDGDWLRWSAHAAEIVPYLDSAKRAALAFRVGRMSLEEVHDSEMGLAWAEEALATGLEDPELPVVLERLRLERGDWAEAARLMQRRAAGLSKAKATETLARAARLLALAAGDANALGRAYAELRDRDPKHIPAWRYLARQHEWADDQVSAIEAWSKVVELQEPDPLQQSADRLRLAQLQAQAGAPIDALKQLDQALAISPQLLPAVELAAALRSELGQWSEARAHHQQLLATDPTPGRHTTAGDLAFLANDVAGARAHYEAAIRIQPGHNRAWWGLAKVCFGEMNDEVATVVTPAIFTPHEALTRLLLALFGPEALGEFASLDPMGERLMSQLADRSSLEQAGAIVDLLHARGAIGPKRFTTLEDRFPAWQAAIQSVRDLWCGGSWDSTFAVGESYRWVRMARMAAMEGEFDERHKRRVVRLGHPLTREPERPPAPFDALHADGAWAGLFKAAAAAFQPPQITMAPVTSSRMAAPPKRAMAAVVRNEGTPSQEVIRFDGERLVVDEGDSSLVLSMFGRSVYLTEVTRGPPPTVRGSAVREARLREGDVLSVDGNAYTMHVWSEGDEEPFRRRPTYSAVDLSADADDDGIDLDDSDFIDLDDDDDTEAVPKPAKPAPMRLTPSLGVKAIAASKPVLIFASGTLEGQMFAIDVENFRIGRGRSNELQISDDGKVSRYHCRLQREGETFRLYDLGSSNGVAVNDERVDEKLLKAGDRLTVGRAKFVFRFASEAELLKHEVVTEELLPDGF